LLSPLREAVFHNLAKYCGIENSDSFFVARGKANNCRSDFGPGDKNCARNLSQILNVMMKLESQRERAVIGASRLRRETSRHLIL
jgi:hypothetical protein